MHEETILADRLAADLRATDSLHAMRAMFAPRSIAVIGASNEMEYGGRALNNLVRAGFSGPVYPVNPRHATIQGIKAYADVRDIPGPVDLAVLVVPARAMNGVIAACGEKGIPAGAVISAGYAEQGPEGVLRQQELLRAARAAGMRISGPNSIGVANLGARMVAAGGNVEWDAMPLMPGHISIVSQSGALGFTSILTRAYERGIGLRNIVSVGNQADLSVADFVNYMVEADDGTRVIGVFLEGLPAGEGRRFVEVARRAAVKGKAILIFKVARSEQGQAAARSHTAALIGKDAIYDGAFRQCNVIRVTDMDDLWEAGQLFDGQPEALNARGEFGIGFLSNSGGMNSVFTDACGAEGMVLPAIQDSTHEAIAAILAGRGAPGNPIDASGQLTKPSLGELIGLLENDPAISIVGACSTTPSSGKRALETAQHMCAAHARSNRPHFMLWTAASTLHGRPGPENSGFARVRAAGVPVFFEAAKCVRALRWLRDHTLGRRALLAAEADASAQAAVALPASQSTSLPADFLSGMTMLEQAGIGVARTLVARDARGAQDAAAQLGYPVVLKIDAPGLAHKTEIGGVVTGIADPGTLQQAYEALWQRTAALGDARRVLVQEQVGDAVEMILGGMNDPVFGPVVMVGTGGIWVELLEDAAFRVAPVDLPTARDMLSQLRGAKLLAGARGAAPRDVDALAGAVVRFSHLVAGLGDRIDEIEVNPVLVLPEGQGIKAVDVLVVPAAAKA